VEVGPSYMPHCPVYQKATGGAGKSHEGLAHYYAPCQVFAPTAFADCCSMRGVYTPCQVLSAPPAEPGHALQLSSSQLNADDAAGGNMGPGTILTPEPGSPRVDGPGTQAPR